jgi:hypothetical protein
MPVTNDKMESSLDWSLNIHTLPDAELPASFVQSEPTDSFVKEIEDLRICEAETMTTTKVKHQIEAFHLTMERERDCGCNLTCKMFEDSTCSVQ